MVPRQAKSRLPRRAATARYWRSWRNVRSTTLRCAGHPRQRPAPGISQQAGLAGVAAPRPAQRLPVPRNPGPAPRADTPAPLSHPPRPSRPSRRPHCTRPGIISQVPSQTSGNTGYQRSSSSRTASAGPATGTRPGSGRRSRRLPAGDHSTSAPATDAPATGNDLSRSTRHALARQPRPTSPRNKHWLSGSHSPGEARGSLFPARRSPVAASPAPRRRHFPRV